MYTKIGQMQDIRALFDEKIFFLEISIFDVNTVIRDFRDFRTFYRFSTSTDLLKYYM